MTNWEAENATAELLSAARVLSRENGDVHSRREAERLLARSEDAPRLYALRDVQCAVHAAEEIAGGSVPLRELRLDWLRVRPGTGADVQTWRDVEHELGDTVLSVQRWREADERRRTLLALPDEARETWIHEEEEFGSYLVARVCLAVEEYERGRGVRGVPSAQLAVRIAEVLLHRHHDAVLGGTGDKLAPSVLTDLLALAWGRLANVHRILGNIVLAQGAMAKALLIEDQVELDAFAGGEVASLHASLLRDEGLELALAEERVDRAVDLFETFDRHLAARTLLLKASIQRLQGNQGYFRTFERVIEGLDAYRDPAAVEDTYNNLLYYLVKERRVAEASRRRYLLPRPTRPIQQARLLGVEGCIELALGHVDQAEGLLEESAKRFTILNRLGDAKVALLYLASVRVFQGDSRGARDHLTTASHIASSCGYATAAAIDRLVAEMDETTDLALRIQEIAFEGGGCLDPRRPGAEAQGV